MLPTALQIRPNATAAGLGGALAIIVVWVLSLFGLNPPPEVAAAITAAFSTFTVEARNVIANGNGKEKK